MNGDLATTYDRIADDWHRDHQTDDWWVSGTDELLSRLPRGAHILDIGCGSGVKSAYMVSRGFRVTGIDTSEGLLTIARREVPEADFKKFSMTELDAFEGDFDAVFAQASLLHIPRKDVAPVVRNMVVKTKPNGLVYLAVKEVHPDKPIEGVVKEHDYGYEYERFFSYFTMEELESYLRDAGSTVLWKARNPNPSGKTVWLQIIGKNIEH